MTPKKQILYTIAVLLVSQGIGQLFPPFSMMFGTPVLVPVAALLINYVFAAPSGSKFAFEGKALIVIAVSVASAALDYFCAPGTHDQVGFAWMSILWLLGFFILCLGLTIIKFMYYIRFDELGYNLRTVLTVAELFLLIFVPISIAFISLKYFI